MSKVTVNQLYTWLRPERKTTSSLKKGNTYNDDLMILD